MQLTILRVHSGLFENTFLHAQGQEDSQKN